MNSTETRLLIMDGNNLVVRSYFAMAKANLTNSDGKASGALYGTIKAFFGYLKELQPTHCVWFFDQGKSDLRSGLRQDYKGHRKYSSVSAGGHVPDPREDLPHQYEALRRFFDIIGVTHYSEMGVEADDLIAQVVRKRRWPMEMDETIIVSNDHDMFQLVSHQPSVKVFRPGEKPQAEKRSSVGFGAARPATGVLYDLPAVIAKYGLHPLKLPEMWALTGDVSDNIAGIPGVGPVTATKWILQHGDLSRTLAYERKCNGYERQCSINLQMIELEGNQGTVNLDLQDCKLNVFKSPDTRAFIDAWGMQSLLDEEVLA